jgi:hypothetical protein
MMTAATRLRALDGLPGLARRTFRRQGYRVLTQGLLVSTALLAFFHVSFPRAFESSCLVMIRPGAAQEPGGLADAVSLSTQERLVMSRGVLDQAAADKAVAKWLGPRVEDPAAALARRVAVRPRPNTFLIEIVGRSAAGGESAAIADAVTAAFCDRSARVTRDLAKLVEKAFGPNSQPLRRLEAQRARLQSVIEDHPGVAAELQARGNDPGDEADVKAMKDRLSAYDQALTRRVRAEVELAAERALEPALPSARGAWAADLRRLEGPIPDLAKDEEAALVRVTEHVQKVRDGEIAPRTAVAMTEAVQELSLSLMPRGQLAMLETLGGASPVVVARARGGKLSAPAAVNRWPARAATVAAVFLVLSGVAFVRQRNSETGKARGR